MSTIITTGVLGKTELEVMLLMWEHDYQTVKEVHKHISDERTIAYTTVMTVMTRMAEKGLLIQETAAMRYNAHRYVPALNKQEFMLLTVQSVFTDLQVSFHDQQQFARVLSTAHK